ncbi:MAG: hypothetical protein ACK4M3_08155, partial [Pyrobaculum sp.]
MDAVNFFASKLEWGRRLPVYEVHKWWARRFSAIVRLFLIFNELDARVLNKVDDFDSFVRQLYFDPPRVSGKRLLDPFAGGGTIIIEASILGYDAVGIDINRLPHLFLNALKELHLVDRFAAEVERFARSIDLWKTKCEKGHDAIVIHTFLAWANSRGELQLRDNMVKRGVYFCEKCGRLYRHEEALESCIYCGNKFGKKHNRVEYVKLVPYAVEYYCPVCNVREVKRPDEEDLAKFYIEQRSLMKIPKLVETRRLLRHGFRDFGQLFTPRQLHTFAAFLDHFRGTRFENLAKVVVSDAVRSCSLLAYYSSRWKKVIPGFVVKSYWMPPQPVELNP